MLFSVSLMLIFLIFSNALSSEIPSITAMTNLFLITYRYCLTSSKFGSFYHSMQQSFLWEKNIYSKVKTDFSVGVLIYLSLFCSRIFWHGKCLFDLHKRFWNSYYVFTLFLNIFKLNFWILLSKHTNTNCIKLNWKYIISMWMYLCRLLAYMWKYDEARIWRGQIRLRMGM